MTSLRVATFNAENLFARWRFGAGVDPAAALKDGWQLDPAMLVELGIAERRLTAGAIQLAGADIVALQEIEGLDTLKRFRDLLLGTGAYPYAIAIDGNDKRLIDVAVLSKWPIVHARSHQHLTDPEIPIEPLFSRDCLEVDVDVDGKALTLFINHLKSMREGRGATRAKRQRQASAVRSIVARRFGPTPGLHPLIVLGDLNDHRGPEDGGPGITELIDWDQIVDVVGRRPPEDRWTHYFREEQGYEQLDYVLLSTSLAATSEEVPEIIRAGLPRHAYRYTGARLDGVGEDEPSASDHCPVVMEVRM